MNKLYENMIDCLSQNYLIYIMIIEFRKKFNSFIGQLDDSLTLCAQKRLSSSITYYYILAFSLLCTTVPKNNLHELCVQNTWRRFGPFCMHDIMAILYTKKYGMSTPLADLSQITIHPFKNSCHIQHWPPSWVIFKIGSQHIWMYQMKKHGQRAPVRGKLIFE